jgi:hypothetical protein
MGKTASLLKTAAKRIIIVAIAAFVVGFCWIVAASPCSNIGVYILLLSVALTALSGCILVARALMIRTLDAFGLAGAIACLAFVQFGLSSFTALMLCRGI